MATFTATIGKRSKFDSRSWLALAQAPPSSPKQRRGPRMSGARMTVQLPRSREALTSRNVTGAPRCGSQKRNVGRRAHPFGL